MLRDWKLTPNLDNPKTQQQTFCLFCVKVNFSSDLFKEQLSLVYKHC